MTGLFPPTVFVELYQSKPRRWRRRPQTWRWRATSAGNTRFLANSGEAYVNRQDCLDAITQLFGTGTNVYLRQDGQGNVLLRRAVD